MKPPLDAIRPAIRALEGYAIEHEAVAVKLDANEASFELPAEIAEALARVAAEADLRRYPPGHSEALVELAEQRFGAGPGTGLTGNGSNEMISLVLTTFAGARPSGAEPVLVTAGPTFGVYPLQAACHGLGVEEVPLRPDFTLDGAAVVEAARRLDAALIILASPNNPTGNRMADDEVQAVLEGFAGPVVVDEAYQPFTTGSWMGAWDRWPNLLVLRTLSKVGLAALRVGFLFAHPELTAELRKAKLPFNLNSLSGRIAEAALRHWESLEAGARAVARERDRMGEALAALEGIRPHPSDANFVLFHVDGDASGLWARLLEQGISIRNVSRKPRLEGCLRVTVGTPEQNDTFLEATRRCLERP